MLKRVMLAAALVATSAIAIPQAASAHPRMECHRVWIHGHPECRCHPVRWHHQRPRHHQPRYGY
ncbi:hypothetical protein [Paraburkholderia tropica]|uniref:hypothetical protein n=1 Tax=Paraburkholderia tropica TaxID=92647 RepID=UPI0012EA41E2|nr:hypothetical protein [Paraburkholderia tropica]